MVGDAEPLVGQVAATVNHELGAEHSSNGPPQHQCGNESVTKEQQRCLGPEATPADNGHGYGQSNTAEAGETALPDGQPAHRMPVVIRPVGGDVGESGADESGAEEPKYVASEVVNGQPATLEATLRVLKGDVGGQREAEAVEVENEGTEVKCGGEGRHD